MNCTIEYEPVSATKGVGNLDETRASLSGECLSGSPATSGKEQVVGGTGLTDGVDGLLNGVDPGGDRGDIVRLVHTAI